MRFRGAFWLALSLVAASAQAAKPAPAPATVFPYAIKTDRLKNGLTVTRVPFHSPGMVAYYTLVRVGSRNEVEPGHSGFAHFFEHVLFKGTPANPEGKREQTLGALGFHENAFTTDDFTVYHQTGPTSGLGTLITLEADRFQNLAYSEPTFQTEAKAVLGEYHKSAASPFLKMEEGLLDTAFTRHPYKHTTLGFYADIQKMPERYAYSREFFKRWYTPDNTQIFVVGDFVDQAVMSEIEKAYGGWAGTVAQVAIPPEPSQGGERRVEVVFPGNALPMHVHAWHSPAASPGTPDAAVQDVLAAYLVSEVSALHKELVLDKQLARELFSFYSPHRDPNLFTIAATLRDEKNRAAVKHAFDLALKAIVVGRIDAKRVDAIKSHKRYDLLTDLDTPDAVAEKLVMFAGAYGTPTAVEAHYQHLAKVTPGALQTFAKRFMTARNRTILTLVSKPPAEAQKGAQP
jgi:zinc protease